MEYQALKEELQGSNGLIKRISDSYLGNTIKMSDIAKNKHHLINVRISMEHNEEYLTEEQVKVQSILSGRYDT